MNEIVSVKQKRKNTNGSNGEPLVAPWWFIQLLRYVGFWLSRCLWGLRYKETKNIPSKIKGGLIIAANHQAYFDPFWISFPIKRPIRYLAWNEAFSWFFVGRILRLLGAWPLRLEKGSPQAMRRSLNWLREGGALVIFPEGERCYSDGKMKKFKVGAIRLALEAGMPILPVTIKGANNVWSRDHTYPRLGKVEIIYHPLQHYSVPENEDLKIYAKKETERLEKIISSALRS
jgi:1-acyl-sn-glycerol-3-phosphate acyltransferase